MHLRSVEGIKGLPKVRREGLCESLERTDAPGLTLLHNKAVFPNCPCCGPLEDVDLRAHAAPVLQMAYRGIQAAERERQERHLGVPREELAIEEATELPGGLDCGGRCDADGKQPHFGKSRVEENTERTASGVGQSHLQRVCALQRKMSGQVSRRRRRVMIDEA